MSGLIAVTGMRREAKAFTPDCQLVLSGGGDNHLLAGALATAIGRGGRAVLSAGLCGGLKPGLKPGTVIVADAVLWGTARLACDGLWRAALRSRLAVVEGPLAGSDHILDQPAQKAAVHAATGALGVDLESHIAAQVADRHGVPFCALRVIADGAGHRLPAAALVAMSPTGQLALPALLGSLLQHPGQLPDLIATGWRAQKAFDSLFRSLRLLGVGLACPYLG